jgi:phosphotriesterase-related protein
MVLGHDASRFIDYFPDPAARAAFQQVQPNWNSTHISTDVLPALRARGVTEEQIRQMLVDTPRRYFE